MQVAHVLAAIAEDVENPNAHVAVEAHQEGTEIRSGLLRYVRLHSDIHRRNRRTGTPAKCQELPFSVLGTLPFTTQAVAT